MPIIAVVLFWRTRRLVLPCGVFCASLCRVPPHTTVLLNDFGSSVEVVWTVVIDWTLVIVLLKNVRGYPRQGRIALHIVRN